MQEYAFSEKWFIETIRIKKIYLTQNTLYNLKANFAGFLHSHFSMSLAISMYKNGN